MLAREQHLTQLDGLAAAAAHELGTPLATITLVVQGDAELDRQGAADASDLPQVARRFRLLDQEVRRCRTILGKLASLGTEEAGPLEEMTLRHLSRRWSGRSAISASR